MERRTPGLTARLWSKCPIESLREVLTFYDIASLGLSFLVPGVNHKICNYLYCRDAAGLKGGMCKVNVFVILKMPYKWGKCHCLVVKHSASPR